MIDETMTNDEKINDDNLQAFLLDKIPVHITLKRIVPITGKHEWVNGKLQRKATDRIWILDEFEIGEIRISLAEISPRGVSRFTEDGR